MKHKPARALLSLICALGLLLPLPAGATGTDGSVEENSVYAAETTISKSGISYYAKLTQEEIVQLLKDNPLTMPQYLYRQAPYTKYPYFNGSIQNVNILDAIGRLNAMRSLAGLPLVHYSEDYCNRCQFGAVLVASTKSLDPSPKRPAGMTDFFYKQALSVAYKGNTDTGLAISIEGSTGIAYSLTGAIDRFMDDSDSDSIATLARRRKQLNPTLSQFGIGMADNYVCEHTADDSGDYADYNFIAWPSSGYFPNNIPAFQADSAWSVTINPKKFQIPDRSKLTITLERESDGKTWVFRGTDPQESPDSEHYFTVDTSNFGVSNCIIFRPEGVDRYEGRYTVRIEGVKGTLGKWSPIVYQVDFFQADPEPTFEDVPVTHWAYNSVEEIAQQGLIEGVGDGLFAPTDSLSSVQFCAMLIRTFYPTDVPGSGTDGTWWEPYYTAAKNRNLLGGTLLGNSTDVAEDPVSRYDMAQMVYRLLRTQNRVPAAEKIQAAKAAIGDWGSVPSWRQESVAACYAAGMLTGMDEQGSFSGDRSMTRAEAVTLLTRLLR